MTSPLSSSTFFPNSADAARHKINNTIIELIAETIKPDIILLFARDLEDLNLMAASGDGFVATSHSNPVHKVGECLCGIAASTAAPVYCSDILADPRCTRDECKNAHMRSYAALPLMAENRVIGVMGVGSVEPRDFSIHSKILEPLAAAISISLNNILLDNGYHQAEEMSRLNESRLESLLKISNKEFESIQQLLDYALDECIKLTSSRIGYIYFYDEQKRQFTLNSWSREVMNDCSVVEQQSVYQLESTGIWGEAVRQRRPIILNDYAAPHPLKKGYPPGHSPLRRFLTIPVMHEGEIVAVIGVANKQAEYDESDVRQLTLMMDAVWKIVIQKKTLQRLIESEKQFRQLYDSMTEGVALHNVIRDAQGQPIDYMIVDVNPSYEKILGVSRDEVIGKRASLVYGMTPAPFLKEFSDVATSKRPMEFEQYYDPITRFFHITIVPWEEDGFATIFFDITQRKMNEDDIKKALSFVESLLKSSPMGIRVFEGASGKCILANQAAADIAGANISELVGQDFRKLQSWQSCGLTAMAEQVLADGEPRLIETNMVTTFDKPVAIRYFLSRFNDNETPYLLVLGRDANEEKRLEEENRRIEAQMLHMQKLESLGVLAGGIAHDFNNILMAILGNTELAMLSLPHDASVNQYLREIERAAKRAADLAHQMLAYSGKGHFVVETLDINRVICEMTALLDVSVSKKAALHLELEQGLPSIKADPAQLSQVIMNLIINASEAMEDQNGDITISTGITACSRELFSRFYIDDHLPPGQYVYMTISDTGCGMDEETISKLFEPFFTTKFTGRGLGMSAVLGIIRSHKGAINVESRKGKGSSFTIYLPVAQHEAAAVPDTHQEEPLQKELRGSGIILLVDDEETIRYMGQAMLELFGFRVITAADGFEALALYKQHCHEIVCVLLDLTMPHMDGEQTFTELRRINPDIKVIMSSGYSELEICDRFDGKGLSGFVQKPYQIQEIERILKKVLEG